MAHFTDPSDDGSRSRLMPPWWLMGLLLGMCIAVLLWRIPSLLKAIEEKRVLGPDAGITNGFDLSTELRSDETLVRFGAPEEVLPIDNPEIWNTAIVDELGENYRTRFLVSESEVVGVVIDGKARAYPYRILQWHEVVNDVLGDVPICVVYHPLSATTTVFQRPKGAAEEPVVFGSSGLVVDCCMLIHERLGPGARSRENLWSPTDGRAISGPRSGEPLQLLPFRLTTWKKWREDHPDTDVLGMAESHRRYYKKEPYSSYRLVDRPRYPHQPKPPAGELANLSPVTISQENGEWIARIRDSSSDAARAQVISSWFAVHAREIPIAGD
ncbi:MAG: DUF3179 domain-containing (seleno)protein [Planctomycetota bacterium]|nr:DUF3179 domain-containing (seleno)protein [Planctomycetota bacterium]